MAASTSLVVTASRAVARRENGRGALMRVNPGKRPSARKARKVRIKKLSRLRKPEDMSLEQWQIALRREFGRQQNFRLKNVGGEPVFSEFEVTNPQTKRTYRVAIRGRGAGRELLLLPRLRRQHAGDLQARRVHARAAPPQPPEPQAAWPPASSRRTPRSTSATGRSGR